MTEPAQQPTPPAATPPAETPPGEERTFTQADLNKIAANEKRDGISSVLSRLGVETLEEAEQIVTTYNEAQAEAQSEFDKAEIDRDKYKSERDEARQVLNQERIGFRLEAGLRDAGVPSERLADALALADRSGLEIASDGTVSGLDDAIKATIEPRPWLTGQQQQQQRRAADVTRRSDISPDDVAPGLGRLRVAYGP